NTREQQYAARRKRVLRQIRGAAALFASPDPAPHSRDQEYPYLQASDLFYLTGFSEPHSALLLIGTSEGPRSILFVKDRDERHERWSGEVLGIKRARTRFQVDEVRDIRSLPEALRPLLHGTRTLHYPAGLNSELDRVVWGLFQST